MNEQEISLTVQGVGSPVPASDESEQAGSQTSSSNDRSAAVVVNLATVAFKATSLEYCQEEWTKLAGVVDGLQKYIQQRHNVHGEIREYACKIQNYLEALEIKLREYTTESVKVNVGTQTMKVTQLNTPLPREKFGVSPSLQAGHQEEITQMTATKNKAKASKKGRTIRQIEQQVPSTSHLEPASRREKTKASEKGTTLDQPQQHVEDHKLPKDDQWQRVSRRKKDTRKGKRPQPPRPDALIIKISETSTYADTLRKVRDDPALKGLGTNISKVRKNNAGNLLIQLDRKSGGALETMKRTLEGALGNDAQIRACTQETLIEIRDLDALTTKEEVAEALTALLEGKVIQPTAVRSMPVAYAGTQTTVVALLVLMAPKAVTDGRIRVGLVITRICKKVQLLHCSRCWEFGHLTKRCQGPDRTKCCHKCGEEGHLASDCTRNPSCVLCAGKGANEHSCGRNKCPTRTKEAEKTYKMRIIQLNLNHCEAAQDLLWQTVKDLRIDVAILSEQYKNLENVAWISDITGRAAIWACGRQDITEATQDPTCGFVWAKI
ncbi:uncharacterized protein, partial [Halyomorpha halys]|uniref:uncharacterized protein n=1 Tax=Halyomorpha halys TaxID=286706 RepID=UPI0034D170E1